MGDKTSGVEEVKYDVWVAAKYINYLTLEGRKSCYFSIQFCLLPGTGYRGPLT